MAHYVVCPQKKIISRIFKISGALIVNFTFLRQPVFFRRVGGKDPFKDLDLDLLEVKQPNPFCTVCAKLCVNFRLGFHAVPSMSQLHLHVISQVSAFYITLSFILSIDWIISWFRVVIRLGLQLSVLEEQKALEQLHLVVLSESWRGSSQAEEQREVLASGPGSSQGRTETWRCSLLFYFLIFYRCESALFGKLGQYRDPL
jgi:hypothetical protein